MFLGLRDLADAAEVTGGRALCPRGSTGGAWLLGVGALWERQAGSHVPGQWDTAQPRPSSSERPVSTLLRGLSPDTWRPVPRPDTSGESVSFLRPSCGSEVHSGLVRGLGQLSGAKGPRTSRRLPARLGRRGRTRRRPDAAPERLPWDLVFERVFRGVPKPQDHEQERHGPRRHDGNEVSPHLR